MLAHSMPLTKKRLSPLAPAHAHLSAIDGQRFYLDDSASRLRFRCWELFDERTIEVTPLSENNGAH
jgi:hypothetical protein